MILLCRDSKAKISGVSGRGEMTWLGFDKMIHCRIDSVGLMSMSMHTPMAHVAISKVMNSWLINSSFLYIKCKYEV